MKFLRNCALAALTVALLCTLCLSSMVRAAYVSSLTFKLNSDGQSYSVSDCNTSASGSLTIPATYYGKPVTAIGPSAFSGCSSLTSVTIPDGVTAIWNSAFYNCSSLTSVAIPDSVTTIGDYAFSRCSSLASITIPDGITSIGTSAFYNCSSLTAITIPSSVTTIRASAFYSCSSLTGFWVSEQNSAYSSDASGVLFDKKKNNIIQAPATLSGSYTITDSVTSIGEHAFAYCSNLTSLTIPDSVTTIGNHAFHNCSSLTAVHIADLTAWCGINFGNALANPLYYAGELYIHGVLAADLTIPAGITAIRDYAFNGCSSLTSVTIPDSVTTIGDSAFEYCRSLTAITIPYGVTTIGDSAFSRCSSLTSITVPGSVTIIGSYAFYNCGSLTSITVPDSVTTIGSYAFSLCYKLTSVTIGAGVTTIGEDVFNECGKLTGIWVAAQNPSYSSDERGVLYNQNKTQLIKAPGQISDAYIIPGSVTTIGASAFQNCRSLTSVTIGNSVTTIGDSAFRYCSGLTSLTIPNGVATIGKNAFYYCNGLTSATIPDSVTTIGNSAFYNCSNLTSVAYCGFAENWDRMTVGEYNDPLLNAQRSYHEITPATCTAPGICLTCSNVREPLGHSGGVWMELISSTCSAEGLKARICDVCGETETAPIEPLPHDYISVTTAPTCTEQGYTTKTCAVCNAAETVDYVAATGHTWGIWSETKAPTCTENGVQVRVCNGCGQESTDSVPALGHSFTSVLTAPTCTEQGYTTKTCSVCNAVETVDYVSALGHSVTSVVTAPTCTEQGYTIRTCSACGLVTETTDITPAKGHTWSAWIQIKASTCSAEGTQTRFCNCGVKETQLISKVPHAYENGFCIVCAIPEPIHMTLTADTVVNMNLENDMYVDLAGYDLSGTIVTNGYAVYLMDSATDGYTCEAMGYFTCVDANGDPVVPVATYAKEGKKYLTLLTEDGYSAHRYHLQITHVSLQIAQKAFGYKAVFYGDPMVADHLDAQNAFGYTLSLGEGEAVTVALPKSEYTSGRTLTLRLENIDITNFGETPIHAKVMIQLSDGTVLESKTVSYSVRNMLELVDAHYSDLSATQQSLLKWLVGRYPVTKEWDISNILQ